jgi:hypothetical protein
VRQCLLLRRYRGKVFGERHLRHLLSSYQTYYNEIRTHLSLMKDAPIPRDVQEVGRVLPLAILGGLHTNMFAFEFATETGTYPTCSALSNACDKAST